MTQLPVMSLRKSVPPLQIELVPSNQLLGVLLLIHGGALVLTIVSRSPVAIQGGIVFVVLASIMTSLHKTGWNPFMPLKIQRLLSCQFITSMIWQADNTWELTTRDGRCVYARLLPTSTCHANFAALNFQTMQQRWWDSRLSVIIFQDSIDREVFRQLRVRLRTSFVQELYN